MSWAVIGNTGLFGAEMEKLLDERGARLETFNRSNLQLEGSAESIATQIGHADIIVNAVGYTQVDKAEEELNEAQTINGLYAGKLADVAVLLGAKYFYISTDYVFDGESFSPYTLSAPTNPKSVYGRSKLLGETLIAQSSSNYTIFRTSWLYGAHGNNFAKTLASKLITVGQAKIVDDQFGTPTWTRDLAEVVYQHGVSDFEEKVVHAVASGYASWFDFAREIAGALPDGEKYFLSRVSTEDLSTAARRPAFSALDNSQTKGPIIGDWREQWRIAAPHVLAEFVS